MEIYKQQQDVHVFGNLVKTFPEGIPEAFVAIMQHIPNGKSRAYYGISYTDESGKALYYAAAAEQLPGEAEKYGYERYTIEKGNYVSVTLYDWRTKTDTIKDVFHKIMQHEKADKAKPCIEWYYNDDEMRCMLQMLPAEKTA